MVLLFDGGVSAAAGGFFSSTNFEKLVDEQQAAVPPTCPAPRRLTVTADGASLQSHAACARTMSWAGSIWSLTTIRPAVTL